MPPLIDAFFRVLVWRPHLALGALYWHLTGRRLRARNRLREAAARAPFTYAVWIRTVEGPTDARAHSRVPAPVSPRFSILLDVGSGDPPAAVRAAVQSALRQSYGNWELLVIGSAGVALPPEQGDPRIRILPQLARNSAEALRAGLEAASGEYLVPLASGSQLAPSGLFRFAEALAHQDGEARVLYGDEDSFDLRMTRCDPWFKPHWDHDLFLAQDYVSQACAIPIAPARRAALVQPLDADCAIYALLLDLAQGADCGFQHVPHVTAHTARHSWRAGQPGRIAAVARQVEPNGSTAEAGPFGTVVVRQKLAADLPLVSIIIPTRDRVELLGPCVDSLLALTDYPNYEVLIVDNGSTEPQTLAYLGALAADPRVRVLAYPQPYNFSAINNFAVTQARGQFLCLLNNDTETIAGDWLGEMMKFALRADAGAVGARLVYADRSIQHAGVVVGLGGAAGHPHRALPDGEPGYFAQAYLPHRATAVTAACLVVAKDKFENVGGFDAAGLAIAYNDVDLCLKLRQAGWHNYYAPLAVLIHHESKSRGLDLSPEHLGRYLNELAVFQQRWDTLNFVDPMHHPSLDRGGEEYRIRNGPLEG